MQKIVKFRKSVKHYFNLIYARQSTGDLWGVLDAIKNAKQVCKNRKEKQKLNVMMAQNYYEMEQYELSSNHFFRLAPNELFRASAFFGIGRNLVCQKRFDLALDYFQAAIKWDVLNVFKEAILEWTNFVKCETEKQDDEDVYLATIKRLLKNGNGTMARKLLSEMKTTHETLALMAFCDFLDEDFSSAEQKAKESLLEKGGQSLAHIVLAKIYEKHKIEKKQKIVQKLLEIDFSEKEDLKRVAMFLSSEKDFFHAAFYFEKLCKIEQFNPINHLFCGLCYYNLKKEQDALASVGKSMWLDEENPVYSFFYDAIKTCELGEKCKISKKLPKEIESAKVENLIEVFFGGSLSKEIDKSYNLLNDILWSYELNDLELTEKATMSLISSKNKKAICLVKKLMLQTSPTPKQKFVILKEALKSGVFENYNFVCKHVYSSFNIKRNELKSFPANFCDGVCSAISYAECFYPKLMLLPKILKKASYGNTSIFLQNMSSKVVACFLLKENVEVFFNACQFFDVDKKLVEDVFSVAKSQEVKSENKN